MLGTPIMRALVGLVGAALVVYALREALTGSPPLLLVGGGLGGVLLAMSVVPPARRGASNGARAGSREVAGKARTGVLLIPPVRLVVARAAVSGCFLLLLVGGVVLVLTTADAPDLAAIPLVLLALLFVFVTVVFVRRIRAPEADALVLTPDGAGPLGARWVAWEEIAGASVRLRGTGNVSRYLVVALKDGQERLLAGSMAPADLADLGRALEAARDDPAARAALATGGADAYAALIRR